MSRLEIVQLIGMTNYEFRMHWRRRGLIVLVLAVTLMSVASVLLTRANTSLITASAALDKGSLPEQAIGFAAVFTTWAPLSMALIFILPMIVSDAIPLDTQHNLKDLLDSLPVTSLTYLLGKLFGMWAAGLASIALVGSISAVAWWVIVGQFDLRPFLEMLGVGAVVLTVLNGGLGLLVASRQPNRKRAIVATLAVIMPCIAFTAFTPGSLITDLNPIRGAIIMYYLSSSTKHLYNADFANFTAQDVLLTVAFGLLELIVIGIAIWGWMRWKDNRL